MEELKVYKCEICGNIVVKLKDGSEALACCGEAMVLIDPKAKDGAGEKHVPVVSVEGDLVKVQVGEVLHPMEESHFIEFIIVQYEDGFDIKFLKPGMEPKAEFKTNKEVKAVYEFCNLHGLWKVEI